MPTDYTGNEAATLAGPFTVQLPSGGDLRRVSGFNPSLQKHADWIASLAEGNTKPASVGPRDMLPYAQIYAGPAGFVAGNGPTWRRRARTSPSSNGGLVQDYNELADLLIPILIPDGATLQTIEVKLKGAAGHAAMPGTKPNISLFDTAGVSGTIAQVGATVVDASGTTTAYQALHSISMTSLNKTCFRAHHYDLLIHGEYDGGTVSAPGPNFVAGLEVWAVLCTFDVDKIDKGGA